MNISVQDLSAVDKEITLTAALSEIEENIEQSLRTYQKQMRLPGFRPGKVPMSIVRKRFFEDVKQEEAARFVQRTFEKDVVTEHKPVGESQLTNFEVKDEINATFKIGVRPSFELTNVDDITIDKLVHDVTDEEVQEEINHSLERAAKWEDETGEAGDQQRVFADVYSLDAEGNKKEEDAEKNQLFDLTDASKEDDDMKVFRDAVKGKKIGEEVEVTVGEGDDAEKFVVVVKNIQTKVPAELNEAFFKESSNGRAENEDEYRSFVKSQMQEYFDQTAERMASNAVIEQLLEKHEFEIPTVFLDTLVNNYIQNFQSQNGGNLPEGFDVEEFRESSKDRLHNDAKWFFISEKLEEKFSEEIELKPEDVDTYLASEAARYGVPVEQMKNFFASNGEQLERMRSSIREQKLMKLLAEQVKANELGKDEFNKKAEEKNKESEN